MTTHYKGITDRFGRPIEKKVLTSEVAGPSITGVRSQLTGYPGDGLNPQRLASILREADRGDPLRYLELAETVEERDLHYVGVLATRRRAVSQLDISVEAASDGADHQKHAEMVRTWLNRDELQYELFDLLDAIGKGWSFTEIMWDTSEGQWNPQRLEWRDPRWFRPAQKDLSTPLLIGEHGEETPLAPGKFIVATMKAKSGLSLRSGLARVVSWAWMFKAYANRDWAIFTQTFGQPIRIGKYGPGATDSDKDTLFRAVVNIAGDCAAIIPESMLIDFVSAPSIGASSDLYEKRVNFLDQQVSKAVLGQTATTDAIAGGHAVSQEHRQVQEDIERADAKALATFINRDLVKVWIDLEYGPQEAYPRVRIGREEAEDLEKLMKLTESFVAMGGRVAQSVVRDKIGWPDPDKTEELLRPAGAPAQMPPQDDKPGARTPPALQSEGAGVDTADPLEAVLANGVALGTVATDAVLDELAAIIASSSSLAEAKERLMAAAPEIDTAGLAVALRQMAVLARLTGRRELLETVDG